MMKYSINPHSPIILRRIIKSNIILIVFCLISCAGQFGSSAHSANYNAVEDISESYADTLNTGCKIQEKISIDFIDPIYPKNLQKKGIEGEVKLLVTISKSGFVSNIETIESSNEKFEQAAKASIIKTKYPIIHCDTIPVSWKFRRRFVFEIE